jgi:hypothetical protein
MKRIRLGFFAVFMMANFVCLIGCGGGEAAKPTPEKQKETADLMKKSETKKPK